MSIKPGATTKLVAVRTGTSGGAERLGADWTILPWRMRMSPMTSVPLAGSMRRPWRTSKSAENLDMGEGDEWGEPVDGLF